MSFLSGGQGIGSAIGFIVGAYLGGFPGAMFGMSLGGMVGLWLDPPDAGSPPKPNDAVLNSYIRSAPVPLCYGQVKCSGGVIAYGDTYTKTRNEGDSDSPDYHTYLNVEAAIAYGEGPFVQYLNFYVNDKLVEDLSESDKVELSFTNYLGTADQTVDPILEDFYANAEFPAIPFKYTAYVMAKGSVGDTVTLPAIAVEAKTILTETDEEDANPIKVIYDFLTNDRYGVGIPEMFFTGNPNTVDGNNWDIQSQYCDELVDYAYTEVITTTTTDPGTGEETKTYSGNPVAGQEPRFRYSMEFRDKTKIYDILSDILLSCRGILRIKEGKLDIHVEKANEIPEFFFHDRYKITYAVGGSSTVSRLYADFSSLPDNFWKGDYGRIVLGGQEIEFIVIAQTSTYIDLDESLSGSPTGNFTLIKDNIINGTFNFSEKSTKEMPNRIRLEYINRYEWVQMPTVYGTLNRLLGDSPFDMQINWSSDGSVESGQKFTSELKPVYRWDVAEMEAAELYCDYPEVVTDTYSLNEEKTRTVRIGGIKRTSQALRMSNFILDYNQYVRYLCEFEVGIIGYLLSIGDIIGVGHTLTNWTYKYFRIYEKEERENHRVKLFCIEYNSHVYSDDITNYHKLPYTEMPTPWQVPKQVPYFEIRKDATNNRIYLLFGVPNNDPYWAGVNVYVKKGANGNYDDIKKTSSWISRVKLASNIDDIVTSIPADNGTLYGGFTDSGNLWIEDEIISYTAIDLNIYNFTGCTRGTENTIAVSHTLDKYIYQKTNYVPYITYTSGDVGSTWYIKVVSYNGIGVEASVTNAIEQSIIL